MTAGRLITHAPRFIAVVLLGVMVTATADAGPFDRDQALATSQAALGRAVGDHLLVRSDGREVRLHDRLGRPLVVSLVFTSCAHICPATTQNLKRAVVKARQALGDESFRVLTIGFDSHRDTPAMMAGFAHRQRADDVTDWEFLAADAAVIEALTAELGFVYQRAGGGFDHLIQTTVLDGDGMVYRQIYGIDFKTPHLIEPLKELVFDTPSGQSLFTELGNRIRLFCTVYDPATDSYRFRYDIFVGLAIGLLLGIAALLVLVREWRRTRSAAHGAGT